MTTASRNDVRSFPIAHSSCEALIVMRMAGEHGVRPYRGGLAANTSQTSGKIVLTLTATLNTSFPTTAAFSCGLNATAADVISGLTFSDTIFVTATKNGSTLKLYIDPAVCVGFG